MPSLLFSKILVVLTALSARQVASDATPTCYVLNNGYWTLPEHTTLESIYQASPFLKPLANQAPFCPAEDAKHDCSDKIRYRTADGTCNNLLYKWWGSRFSPYQRLLEPEYYLRGTEFVPRVISESNRALPDSFFAESLPETPVHSGLNAWFTFFGQFVGNDLANTVSGLHNSCPCANTNPECFNIETPTFEDQECIPFPRSTDVKHAFDCYFKNREQFTKGTHFLDMDNLYGSTREGQRIFRTYRNGELKQDNIEKDGNTVESLPIADINQCLKTIDNAPEPNIWRSKGCIYAANDERVDDFTFLTITTLLMQRAHNEIARSLAGVNPYWSDEILYQEARRILIALYQNIIYSEYLELLLGSTTMRHFYLNPLQDGYSYNYDEYLYPNNYNEFVTAGFRLHHTVPDKIRFLDPGFGPADVTIPSLDPISMVGIEEMASNNWLYYDQINTLLISFLGEGTLTAQFSLVNGMNHLQLNPVDQDPTLSSMGAFNVQRGRDHGLRSYAYYRQLTGRSLPMDWADLETEFSSSIIGGLSELYDSPADIDLWIGLIAEKPDNDQLLASTQRWIVAKNFFGLKYGDRFFYENGHDYENRFTPEQLESIRAFSFSSLLCLAFKGITEENKMPEYGFFMPNALIGSLVASNDFEEDNGKSSCPNGNDRPVNDLFDCDSLPQLDFTLWKGYVSY